MQFSIAKDAFIKPLALVIGAVERKQTLPILGAVLLSVKNGRLEIRGTDLEIEWQATLELENSGDGVMALAARKLMDICRSLPDNELLRLEADEGKCIIRAGKSRFSLAPLAFDEFPQLEESPGNHEFMLPAAEFRKLLQSTSFSMAHQDVRYYLNGLLLGLSDEALIAVATDGHRLAKAAVQESFINMPLNKEIILPRKAILEIERLLGDEKGKVAISLSEHHIQVATQDYKFTSKLIDGKFPDYRKVVPPADERQQAFVDKDALKQALTRTMVVLSDKTRGAALQFGLNYLKIIATNQEGDESEDEIEISYAGDPLEIALNVSYVQEFLSIVHSSTIKITVKGGNQSLRFETLDPLDPLYVVMPMRL